MEQEVTRFFILFHTGTTLIDRPIDSCSFAGLLFVVRLSLVCLCSVSRSLYTKKRRPTSGLSANRHIWLFDPDESRHAGVNGFLRGCPLFSSEYAHVRVGFSDYRSFWYMPSALGYLSVISILQLYYIIMLCKIFSIALVSYFIPDSY